MYYTAMHSSHRLQVLVEFSRKVSKLLRSSPTLSRLRWAFQTQETTDSDYTQARYSM